MTTVAATLNNGLAEKVNAVTQQQRRLLKRFESVGHYIGGVCAGMFLPGIDQTFDSPVRRVVGRRRPPLLIVEVTDSGSLNFSGAISRLRNGKLVYAPIFSYDISIPYTPRGGGRVLPANNLVLARRANDLLAALIDHARAVADGDAPALDVLRLPRVIRDGNQIVAEDYSPVLGLEVKNPAANFETVVARKQNPAPKILARHGIDYPLSMNSVELDDLVAEFCAEFPDCEIDWSSAVSALLFDHDQFEFALPLADALEHAQGAVLAAMRNELPARYRWEASDSDLLTAARNPADHLRISRLSAVQLFPVETAYDLPGDYAGTVLAPVDWQPPAPGGGAVLVPVTDDDPAPTLVEAEKKTA